MRGGSGRELGEEQEVTGSRSKAGGREEREPLGTHFQITALTG